MNRESSTDTGDTQAEHTMTLLDRTIPVRPISTLTHDQMGIFYRVMRQAVRTDRLNIESREKIDRILAKLLDDADNQWLDDQIIDGTLTWTDVLAEIMACLLSDPPEEKAPATGPQKRARRGRS